MAKIISPHEFPKHCFDEGVFEQKAKQVQPTSTSFRANQLTIGNQIGKPT